MQVLLRGQVRRGRGVAYSRDRQPDVVEEGLRQWVHGFPRIAKRMGIAAGDEGALAKAAVRSTILQISLER